MTGQQLLDLLAGAETLDELAGAMYKQDRPTKEEVTSQPERYETYYDFARRHGAKQRAREDGNPHELKER